MNPGKCALLEDVGVKILQCQTGGDKHIDIMAALRLLGDEGITRLLVEGGGQILSSLLKAERVDQLHWFRSSSIMGDDGISAIAPYNIGTLADIQRFNHKSTVKLGDDQIEFYESH